MKDNIDRGGEKFGAEEVENLIGRHPHVADVRSWPVPGSGVRREGVRLPDHAPRPARR